MRTVRVNTKMGEASVYVSQEFPDVAPSMILEFDDFWEIYVEGVFQETLPGTE